MDEDRFSGIWPALITPIGKDKEPDFAALEKLTELMIKQGLDGLYLLGSTGQGFLLSESQRMEIAETVLSVSQSRIPVMVQVGSLTTDESIRLAKHAEGIDASGISSVGPVYYSTGDGSAQMALQHYRSIAESTELPFFPYQLGQNNFSEGLPAFVAALMEIPNVRGMKLTTKNLLEISDFHFHSQGSLQLFSGVDELFCQAAMCGATGAIGSMYNLWGEECKRVREAFIDGNVAVATEFMLNFQQVIFSVLPNIWSFLRQAMKFRYDIDVGMPIAPLGNNNDQWPEEEIEILTEKVSSAANMIKAKV